MNSKRFVVAALAAAACFSSHTALAAEQDTWLEYAARNGLPLTAVSNPAVPDDWLVMEMSLGDGNADRAGKVRALTAKYGNGNGHSGNGNGNGNGHTAPAKNDPCADPLTREVAREDGNPQGDDLRCK